jgi:hypothetical protein
VARGHYTKAETDFGAVYRAIVAVSILERLRHSLP